MQATNKPAEFDEQGFSCEVLSPWPPEEAVTVFSPERTSEFAAERWDRQAHRFFSCRIAVSPPKRYDAGWPVCDAGALSIARTDREHEAHAVLVRTVLVERAPKLLERAYRGAADLGGAGFDVLVNRTRRVWQLQSAPSDDPAWPLLAATVLASVLLGPILTADGKLMGIKTARQHLDKLGLR